MQAFQFTDLFGWRETMLERLTAATIYPIQYQAIISQAAQAAHAVALVQMQTEGLLVDVLQLLIFKLVRVL